MYWVIWLGYVAPTAEAAACANTGMSNGSGENFAAVDVAGYLLRIAASCVRCWKDLATAGARTESDRLATIGDESGYAVVGIYCSDSGG